MFADVGRGDRGVVLKRMARKEAESTGAGTSPPYKQHRGNGPVVLQDDIWPSG